jgi:hypothetical protein
MTERTGLALLSAPTTWRGCLVVLLLHPVFSDEGKATVAPQLWSFVAPAPAACFRESAYGCNARECEDSCVLTATSTIIFTMKCELFVLILLHCDLLVIHLSVFYLDLYFYSNTEFKIRSIRLWIQPKDFIIFTVTYALVKSTFLTDYRTHTTTQIRQLLSIYAPLYQIYNSRA